MTTTTDTTTVHVHRADATRSEPVPPVTICIDLAQPDHNPNADGYARHTQTLFATDAARIADALGQALPGGTLDALLAELMTRRATLFRVRLPWAAEEATR